MSSPTELSEKGEIVGAKKSRDDADEFLFGQVPFRRSVAHRFRIGGDVSDCIKEGGEC